uniref:PH124R n=1 Tax=African swine fever virus TaxID=10497 RepID=A0A6G7KTW9_ASF
MYTSKLFKNLFKYSYNLPKKYVLLWAEANPPIGITTLQEFAQNVHPCRCVCYVRICMSIYPKFYQRTRIFLCISILRILCTPLSFKNYKKQPEICRKTNYNSTGYNFYFYLQATYNVCPLLF